MHTVWCSGCYFIVSEKGCTTKEFAEKMSSEFGWMLYTRTNLVYCQGCVEEIKKIRINKGHAVEEIEKEFVNIPTKKVFSLHYVECKGCGQPANARGYSSDKLADTLSLEHGWMFDTETKSVYCKKCVEKIRKERKGVR